MVSTSTGSRGLVRRGCARRPRGRLIAWTVIFPIQTAVVHADQPDDISSLYFVFNAATFGLGIALNVAGSRFPARRSPDLVTMAGQPRGRSIRATP